MKTILGLIVLVLTFNHAFAGGEVGNGGNVVVCADSSGRVKSVELLDYYELRLNGGLLSLNPKLETYQEKLIDLFNKWREVAPKRMDQYTLWLNEFQAEAGIYSGIEIPHIPDTGSIAIPQGCKSISIAFQREDGEIFPGTKRYVINKDLWDYMDETQKAGLVLHELIYREAIKAKHDTSLPTRYFNGYLSSADPGNGEEYAYIVSKLPFLWVEYGRGVILKIGEIHKGCIGDNCNPSFRRLTTILDNGKQVSGTVEDVISDFNLNGLNIKFGGMGNKKERIFFNLKDQEMNTNVNMNEISLQNKFHFEPKDKNYPFEYVKIDKNRRVQIRSYSDFLPEKSWFMNSENEIIRDIYSVSAPEENYHIQTLKGYWGWDDTKGMYVLYQHLIVNGREEIQCTLSLESYYKLECPSLPSQRNCGVLVKTKDSFEHKYTQEKMNIVSHMVYVERWNLPRTVNSSYRVLLPKGQIVGYEKQLGKTKAIKLTEEQYVKFSFDENGQCKVIQ